MLVLAEPLQELHPADDRPLILTLKPGDDLKLLKEKAAAMGCRCPWLDGRNMKDKDGILAEFASAFPLPDYFGRNWDALEECLGDPGLFKDCQGCMLFIEHSEALGEADAPARKMLLDILESVAQGWASQTPSFPFKTVLIK